MCLLTATVRVVRGVVFALLLPSVALAQSTTDPGMQVARERVLPVVVSIMVVREDFNQGQPVLSVSSGSGTVVTPDGHIATNAHVVQKGRNFRVVFADGRELPARLIGSDALTDLAVLQVLPEIPETFRHARFAQTLDLSAGDPVYAMGAPWGLSNSMSAGVVNNPRRLLVSLFGDEADYEARLSADEPTGRYYAWIQHDASIAPGNSGGPLVDAQGRIVGVNSRGMIVGGDLAFAIPGPDAAAVIDTLIAKGTMTRAHLGFRLRSLKGSPHREGVLVYAIERDSDAEKAGLKVGDRILRLDGQQVDAQLPVDVPAVQRRIAELPIGRRIPLQIERGGKQLQLTLVTEALARSSGDERAFATLGLSAAVLTPAMRRARNLDEPDGLLVLGLRPGGAAAIARPPLQRGDLLTRINGRPLPDFEALESALSSVAEGQLLKIEFSRNAEQRLAVLQPQPADRERVPLPELPKAWAGAEVQPLPASLARDLGIPAPGFRIVRLYADGPLAAAKARVGDVLTAVDGEPLRPGNETSDDGFQQRVRDLIVGSEVNFDLLRDGKPVQLQVRLVEAPLATAGLRTRALGRLRLQLRTLGFYDRAARRLPADFRGVLVEGVEAGGPAGLAHLRNGDVIVALAGHAVDTPASLADVLEGALKSDPRAAITFTVLRGAEKRMLYLDPIWLSESP